ncbi:ribosome small subunit-dependent GTPase A [bacterium]|nr:ribosome small subunit-dependent GTPase A [bacterium]
MNLPTLNDLGWNDFFEAQFTDINRSDWIVARVIRQDKHGLTLQNEQGVLTGKVIGRLRKPGTVKSELPVVGDWVTGELLQGENKLVIHAVLPRKSRFSRKVPGMQSLEQVVAANMDILFLVSGLDNDFNPRRIERYITLAWDSGARPVILLNKTDLLEDTDDCFAEASEAAIGVDVHLLSATAGSGLDAIRQYINPGVTIAFLGSSGVGKSTIINALLGNDYMKTNEVRENDSRGRHTTTHRELILFPDGGMLIDTPGMREVQLWATDESLDEAFADITQLAVSCKFSDCAHETEPHCSVKSAIESGDLSEKRYQSYLKLKREVESIRLRSEAHIFEKRQKQKEFGKMVKTVMSDKMKLKNRDR